MMKHILLLAGIGLAVANPGEALGVFLVCVAAGVYALSGMRSLMGDPK